MPRHASAGDYKNIPGNQTPNTPEVSESQLAGLKVDDLRNRAKEAGVSGVSRMRKQELVNAVAQALASTGGTKTRASRGKTGKGPESGRGGSVRGPKSSKSLKYAQEIRSPQDEPERPGRSLVTTSHEVIRQWAEERGATPATVEGTEHDDHLGVLRFDFPGYGGETLRHVGGVNATADRHKSGEAAATLIILAFRGHHPGERHLR
ncbi:Rho termination factor N-terminal domain-containing protein [Nonomuraea sp. SYSU D8015]|uniref:Rho termination factor N-terminal domain-containing protein n=1 Tax=Nonomuraea sp. SYSU D8015 TaxID=2593644 RepID=UPI0016602959|nr:Rho termination factor N-terminal domain-containing protein [Nonomuraea sp. SYSU D8015]